MRPDVVSAADVQGRVRVGETSAFCQSIYTTAGGRGRAGGHWVGTGDFQPSTLFLCDRPQLGGGVAQVLVLAEDQGGECAVPVPGARAATAGATVNPEDSA